MSIFSWLRRMVKHAFLAGVNDAISELEAEEPSDWHDEAIESLKHRLQVYEAPADNLAEAVNRLGTEEDKSYGSNGKRRRLKALKD